MTEEKIVDDEKTQEKGETPGDSTNKKQELPKASFILLLSGIATQAYIQLGEVDNPLTKKNEQNIEQAKYTIDTLLVLEEKTKGNLSADEKKYLENILNDLRTRYINKAK